MSTWQNIYNQKIQEGLSEESAYKFATEEMNSRRFNFNPISVVGMEEAVAKEKLDENGYSLRVTRRDIGDCGGMNLDYRMNRCNVSIVRGCVNEIIFMG